MEDDVKLIKEFLTKQLEDQKYYTQEQFEDFKRLLEIMVEKMGENSDDIKKLEKEQNLIISKQDLRISKLETIIKIFIGGSMLTLTTLIGVLVKLFIK